MSIFANIARRQAGNLRRKLLGLPLTPPSIGSMTLGPDDFKIAREWEAQPERWSDQQVVDDYQSTFAKQNNSKFAYAFMGGRVALSACLHALELDSHGEVIVPGYTCIVVPNAIRFAGLKPVYADIELDTYGLSIDSFKSRITPSTKAVILHHLYGLVCRDYEAILELAKQHGIYVIEDCAHATGAVFKGSPVGNLGDVAFYSSEQSKIWNTAQGGMAVTNSEHLANRLRDFADAAPFPSQERTTDLLSTLKYNYLTFKHTYRWITADWAQWKYGASRLESTTQEEVDGNKPAYYGCKMPAPLAAIGMNQLSKVDSYNDHRRATAKKWDTWCDENQLQKPLVVSDSSPVYLRYPVLVSPEKKRNRKWAMSELGVSPGVWFKTNIHPAPEPVHGCPNANLAVERCINLPTILQ